MSIVPILQVLEKEQSLTSKPDSLVFNMQLNQSRVYRARASILTAVQIQDKSGFAAQNFSAGILRPSQIRLRHDIQTCN